MEGVFIVAETRSIIIDAGHGGAEPGALFQDIFYNKATKLLHFFSNGNLNSNYKYLTFSIPLYVVSLPFLDSEQ